MAIPSAFISYSHDSQDHKRWVLELATRLRNTGVDAIIDQWELKPGDDLPHFMETNLAKADRVLMVCTDRYVEKANAGTGGVGYEKMIVTADLLKRIDSNKVIPLIRQSGTYNVPTFLKSKLFLNFSLAEQFELSFDELGRVLHGAPLFEKPPIGNNPFQNVAEVIPDRTGDLVLAIMSHVVRQHETSEHKLNVSSLLHEMGVSRVLFDLAIASAVQDRLITVHDLGWINLQLDGKKYAVRHELVK